jgi:hypothetical protein
VKIQLASHSADWGFKSFVNMNSADLTHPASLSFEEREE